MVFSVSFVCLLSAGLVDFVLFTDGHKLDVACRAVNALTTQLALNLCSD